MIRIRRGTHKSFRLPKFTFGNAVYGSTSFKGDFTYVIDKQGDTNKLVGFSDGISHHRNSIRIGWRYYHGVLEIMAIVYASGKRKITHLAFADTDVVYDYSITISDKTYNVRFGDMELNLPRTSKWKSLRYMLWPYFGGTTKAPKDFNLTLSYTVTKRND